MQEWCLGVVFDCKNPLMGQKDRLYPELNTLDAILPLIEAMQADKKSRESAKEAGGELTGTQSRMEVALDRSATSTTRNTITSWMRYSIDTGTVTKELITKVTPAW